ncbi:uncharacterized protein CcaverHIS019_0106760 [Cutaneotrichosporon cavernicola]|uniref:Uncharacterized protein n=1 Tax=Cutaneotrichosporon cavernicola TaxID=279322 RepID=A0AA48IDT4_9TREE|nr:uncharacterized protein CcaverHIS019_0106760 [Cutaneotrichosporon cavernicola]BEI87958.1 hypothetical protein CcaverHIS019_0106760 [Cutaneotrichosporon cavernicola]
MSANGKSATSPSAQAWGQPDTNVPVDDTETSTTVTKNHRNRHKKNSSPSLLSLSGNASTPNSQPTSATPAPQVVIDASAYPHILRAIFDRAPFEALLVLGQGCKEFHDLANSHLTHHLVIASNIVQSARGGVPPTFFPPNGHAPELASSTLATVRGGLPVFKNDRHLRGFDFPPSVNKIVVNVPWCVRDKSHAYRGVFFSSAADYVVVFVETNLYAPPRYVRPNILRPLLGAYAVGFKIAHNSSRPGPRSITFVGLPSDNLFRKSEHLTTEECCVSATDFLRGRLDKLVDDDILSVPRVDEIIGNVNFLSGADYRATVSYRQYLLETSVSPYNLV